MKNFPAIRKLLTGILSATIVVSLNGCLINRAVDFRDQFCDFDSNFSVHFAESPGFRFHNPVLLDSDVLWMMDARPTQEFESGNEKRMVFVIEKAVEFPDPADDIRVEMKFERVDDQFKLAGIHFDPKLSALINPDMIDQATIDATSQTMCETGYSLVSRKVEIDISGQNLDELPNRLEILELLGPPVKQETMTDSFTYEYRFKGENQSPLYARFTVWFDDSGQNPARIDSQYSHFYTSADFAQMKMTVQVKI